jgi:hypothetical protein
MKNQKGKTGCFDAVVFSTPFISTAVVMTMTYHQQTLQEKLIYITLALECCFLIFHKIRSRVSYGLCYNNRRGR